MHGTFDAEGHPRLPISVHGIRRRIVVDALVDTMFDGMVSLPVQVALPLELELAGEIQVELGDGSLRWEFTFLAEVGLGREPLLPGEIILSHSEDSLAGNQMFQGRKLEIDYVNRAVAVTSVPRRREG